MQVVLTTPLTTLCAAEPLASNGHLGDWSSQLLKIERRDILRTRLFPCFITCKNPYCRRYGLVIEALCANCQPILSSF